MPLKKNTRIMARRLEVIQRACWKRRHVRWWEMRRGSVHGISFCDLSVVRIDESPDKILHPFANSHFVRRIIPL